LEKYYPTKEVWRFFQKPKGLDLDKTMSERNEGSPPIFAVLFYFLNIAGQLLGCISNIPKKSKPPVKRAAY